MKFFIFITLLFIFIFPPFLGAENTLAEIEMASWGRTRNDEFGISSIVSANFMVQSGDRYDFLLGFSMEMEDLNIPIFIGFDIAKLRARNILNLPLDITYFIGYGDSFATGDEFPGYFGISPFGTDFRGFFYFPAGIYGSPLQQYNGIYSAIGTGLSFSLTKWDNLLPIMYIYYNFLSSTVIGGSQNLYSADFRLLFNHSWLRMEAFTGASLNKDMEINIRSGLMAHFGGDEMSFFIQGGISGWDINEDFTIDSIYFLMEPRLRFGNFALDLTFFYHPVIYNHITTISERGRANLNLKVFYRDSDTNSGLSGGLETGSLFDTNNMNYFTMYFAPFLSFNSNGLRWDMKFKLNLFQTNPEEMVEVFFGVRTAL